MFSRVSVLPIRNILKLNSSKFNTRDIGFRKKYSFQSKVAKGEPISDAQQSYKLVGLISTVAGTGLIGYYLLNGKNSNLSVAESSIAWPQYIRDRIHKTYGYFAAGLGATAVTANVVFRNNTLMRFASNKSMPMLLLSIGFSIGSLIVTQMIPYENTLPKHLSWLAFCGANGFFVAPLCLVGGQIIQRAVIYTFGIVSGLSAVACIAPSDKFIYMGGPLAMGLGALIVSNIAQFFTSPFSKLGAGLIAFQMYGGLMIFSGFLLYDTQRIVQRAINHPHPSNKMIRQFDPINSSISIYLDTFNIFIRIVMMLSGSNSKKK